jgi:hypothetical protein
MVFRSGITSILPCLVFLAGLLISSSSNAGAYIFAGEANGIDVVTHPTGYTGSGGTLTVRVCIDPTSTNAASMELPVQNNINIYNRLQPTTGNLQLGGSNNIASNQVDFESVALHELGHCIGMAHVNAASESGLTGNNQNYTKATDGANNVFNINSGSDGIIGSSDDNRGDDVNLHWFRISNNNPFTIAATVDSSTYARDTGSLPGGHSFAANADRTVATALGAAGTESVMQQLTFFDEAQRLLTHDDVATLLYAASGLDENASTGDDYTIELEYGGLTTSNCDVVMDFDNNQTGFAVCGTGGAYIGNPNNQHVRITSANIYFNTGFNWFYNTISNNQPPVLAAIGNQSLDEGDSLSVNLSTSNPDNDNQTFSVTGLPGFASLTDHGNDTATLDIDPLAGDAGTYNVTITVTDDSLPNQEDSETFDIIVSVANPDTDGDGVPDSSDNCPDDHNPLQDNNDEDSEGDACDSDDDNDGLSDTDETNTYNTDPFLADSDGDNLTDYQEVITYLTDPNLTDTDVDGLDDDVEINTWSTDPLNSNLGDVGPFDNPDNQWNAADLVVMTRLVTGALTLTPGSLQDILGDMNGDNEIDVADLLLLQQLILNSL